MKKLFTLMMLMLITGVSAWADFVPGTYIIRPYTAQTKCIIPSSVWFRSSDNTVKGPDKVVYTTDAPSSENGGYWVIANATSGGGFTITPEASRFVDSAGQHGYLNPWGGSSNVGCWTTTNGGDRWDITQVEGNVYTFESKENAGNYFYYNSGSSNLQYNVPGTPNETNYFVIEKVAVFPDAGTYFVTFKGMTSDRKNWLYNDLTQPDGYTLQAQDKGEGNDFIWKAVCDGTNMTIVNGQGSTMKLKNNSGDRTFNKINYVAHSGNYYLKPVLSEGTLSSNGHDCLNVSNGSYTNAAGTHCLTSWSTTSGPNASDNHWAVNVVDMTGLNEYTVNITGDAPGAYVTYNGQQHAANGGFFLAASIAQANLTAATVAGYEASAVTLVDHTITVAYTRTAVPYTVKILGANLGVTIKGQNYVDGNETAAFDNLETTDVVLAADENYVGSVVINGTNIVVTYHHKGAAIDFTGKKVAVGEKATIIVPDTKWYVLTQLRGGETPTWINAENKVMRANETAATLFPGKAVDLASYLVRFVSTNVDGVYEIQHGNGKYWNTEGANNRKLTASGNVIDSKFYFVYGATQSTSGADASGWAMNYTTDFATKADKVDNDGKNSTVGYWASGNITSGTNNVWYLYETTFTDLPTYDWEEFETKLQQLQRYTFGSKLGQYAEVDLTEYYINSVGEALELFADDFNAKSEDNYAEDLEIMDLVLDNLTINQPKAGSFLRIKGGVSNEYADANALADQTNRAARVGMSEDATGAGSVWYLDADNHFISFSKGYYITNTCDHSGTADNASVFSFRASDRTIGRYGIYTSGARMYDNGAPANRNCLDRQGGAANETENWILEEVESLPVLFKGVGRGYATIYSPVALKVPAGVTAYVGKEEQNGALKVSPIEDGVIPANKGVVLKYDNMVWNEGTQRYDDYTATFEITTGGSATSTISGTYATIAADENSCVFALQNGNAGFYKYSTTDGATLAGFKAYYENTTSATRGFALDFGDVVTAISQLSATTSLPTTAFDLAGRRVNAAQKGILIQNGNKVIR